MPFTTRSKSYESLHINTPDNGSKCVSNLMDPPATSLTVGMCESHSIVDVQLLQKDSAAILHLVFKTLLSQIIIVKKRKIE